MDTADLLEWPQWSKECRTVDNGKLSTGITDSSLAHIWLLMAQSLQQPFEMRVRYGNEKNLIVFTSIISSVVPWHDPEEEMEGIKDILKEDKVNINIVINIKPFHRKT